LSTREAVKGYQRRLAELDAEHSRAQSRLAAAQRKRAEVLAAQDRLVAQAQQAVYDAVVAMAAEVGPELAASLAGLHIATVRQLVRRSRDAR
jgi:hypothetical protein